MELDFDFNRYHSLEAYENYLESIAKTFSDLVQLKVIGFTHEGRRLLCLKVLIRKTILPTFAVIKTE